MPRPKIFRRSLLTKKWKNSNGIPELVESLNRLGESVEGSDIYALLLAQAKIGRDDAKARVAVDPQHDDKKSGPHIRDVIFASEGDPSKNPKGPTVIMGVKQRDLKPANRAVLLERGTSRTAAQPFWRPMLVALRPVASANIANGLREIIQKAAFKT